ncbi:Retrotransposable element Tf2 [Sesbania bispinosa]|nr:Retrotransposable element Tf2 [Sesbania bispinosa]
MALAHCAIQKGTYSIEDKVIRLQSETVGNASKMIPRFDGKNAYWWLINVEQYFDGRGIPEEEKLSWAWLTMEGWEEIQWWYCWRSNKQDAMWWDFVKFLLKKFQPEFDPDIWVQEEGSESWEQDNRRKNEALKFKNQLGREEAIHKEVEQVQEADVANKIKGEDSDADLGDRKTKKECFKEVITIRFGNSDVSDKDPPPELPDWVACVVFDTTPAEQVVILLQRNVLRKGTRSKSRKKSTKMVNCQPRWILCKSFKQKLEAGLVEAFKGSWQQGGSKGHFI